MKNAMILLNLLLGGLSVWGLIRRNWPTWLRLVFVALCLGNVLYFASALLFAH
jgi:hypothetical protein